MGRAHAFDTRFPIGRPSRLLINQRGLYSVRCARTPANLCVLGERGLTDLTFYALDPVEGKSRELARTPVNLAMDRDNWDLSPDGSKIAIALGDEPGGHIRVVSLAGAGGHGLIINGHSGFQSMDWSADARGCMCRAVRRADLLHVDLQGHVETLRQQIGSFATWGVPSPDGRHLAFLEWTSAGNVWMREDF